MGCCTSNNSNTTEECVSISVGEIGVTQIDKGTESIDIILNESVSIDELRSLQNIQWRRGELATQRKIRFRFQTNFDLTDSEEPVIGSDGSIVVLSNNNNNSKNSSVILPGFVGTVHCILPAKHNIPFEMIVYFLHRIHNQEKIIMLNGFDGLTTNDVKINDKNISLFLRVLKEAETLNDIDLERLKPFYISLFDYSLLRLTRYGYNRKIEIPKDEIGEKLKLKLNNNSNSTVGQYLSNLLNELAGDVMRKDIIFNQSNLHQTIKSSIDCWNDLMKSFKFYMLQPRIFLIAMYYDMDDPNWDELLKNVPKYAEMTKTHLFDKTTDIPVRLGDTHAKKGEALTLTELDYSRTSDGRLVVEYKVKAVILNKGKFKELGFDFLKKDSLSESRCDYVLAKNELAWRLVHEVIGHLKHYYFIDRIARKDSFSYLKQEPGCNVGDGAYGGELYLNRKKNQLVIIRHMCMKPSRLDKEYLTNPNVETIKVDFNERPLRFVVDLDKIVSMLHKIDEKVNKLCLEESKEDESKENENGETDNVSFDCWFIQYAEKPDRHNDNDNDKLSQAHPTPSLSSLFDTDDDVVYSCPRQVVVKRPL